MLERHRRAGTLGGELERDAFVRLDAQDHPVGIHPLDMRAAKQRVGRLMEADGDLGPAALQVFAGAQVERHAGPAPIVDLQLAARCRSRSSNSAPRRVPGDKPGPACPDGAGIVLAAHGILQRAPRRDRAYGLDDLGLLGADRVGIEGDRRLHGRQRQQLEHVVGHHVAQRAGLLVELAAPLDADGLRRGDLDMVDVLAVPQRLEQAVGEAQRHDVLHRFLAEEMVHPVDLMLLQRLQDLGIERLGRWQIMPERLLDHDPAPLAVLFRHHVRRPQARHDDAEEAIGDGEIEQVVACRAGRLVEPRQMLASAGCRLADPSRSPCR